MVANPDQIWSDMERRLMRLTLDQLMRLVECERIDLGMTRFRKESVAQRIVAVRKKRATVKQKHPWRAYGTALQSRR